MKRITLLATAFAAFAFTACQEDATTEEQVLNEVYTTIGLDSETSVESTLDDIDVIVDAGMDHEPAADGGRKKRPHHDRRDQILDCATVTKDTVAQTITIDYGDGCTGPNGVTRKGKILVTYSGRHFELGSYRIVTFEDFFVDSLQIEGTRTVTNISESDTTEVIFETSLVGGKVTFGDGTFATREAEHVRTWYRGANPEEDLATLTGSATGTNRDGVDYISEIISELVFKRECREERVVIPVSGVMEMTSGENVATVDFGDGTCDNEVTVTINGETTTKTIEPKGRIKRRK